MKILKIETNSQLEKSLGIVFDLALKSAGIQTLEHVNFILNSFQTLPEEQAAAAAAAEATSEIIKTLKNKDSKIKK